MWGRAAGFSWWWDLATSRVGFQGEDPTDGSRGVAGTPTMGRGGSLLYLSGRSWGEQGAWGDPQA